MSRHLSRLRCHAAINQVDNPDMDCRPDLYTVNLNMHARIDPAIDLDIDMVDLDACMRTLDQYNPCHAPINAAGWISGYLIIWICRNIWDLCVRYPSFSNVFFFVNNSETVDVVVEADIKLFLGFGFFIQYFRPATSACSDCNGCSPS